MSIAQCITPLVVSFFKRDAVLGRKRLPQSLGPRVPRSLACIITLALLTCLTPGYAQQSAVNNDATTQSALYERDNTYSIFRKGKKIGTHRLSMEVNGDQLKVNVDSKITVRVLKVPVFRFRYVSEERWQNNTLVSVKSETTTNNETEKASLITESGQSTATGEKGSETTSAIAFATNHWHIGAVTQSVLFNTIKGTASKVSVDDRGLTTVTIDGTDIEANHYVYSGDIQAESWYDKSGRWVKLAFEGNDGSAISYVLDKL